MVTFYVEVEGKKRGDAFTTPDQAHAWATQNLGPGVFYTLTRIGPNSVGATASELYKTPVSD